MSLWVDKYRPRTLSALTYNDAATASLRSVTSSGDLPHLLVYGPSGAGKKTRVVAALRELYGPGVEKLKIDQRVFQATAARKVEINIVSSLYHLELSPSDVGYYDRAVVQELLKDVAQTQQVTTSARHRFKVVVINEADSLSRDAQSALRRTMEKYSPNLRLILIANTTSKIISPIRSRCLLIRISAPTYAEIESNLRDVVKQENIANVSDKVIKTVVKDSSRNLRRALLMLEAVHSQTGRLDDDNISVTPPDWETYVEKVAKRIVEEQSPQRILDVRSMLYELLSHCIPATQIIKTLCKFLVIRVDEAIQGDIVIWAAYYEHRIQLGSKVIFHLEAYVAKVSRIIAEHILNFA